MNDKIYLGSGKEIGKYGNIAISMAIEDLEQYSKPAKNGKHYINLIVSKKKEKDKWGKTHYVALDNYNPKEEKEKTEEEEIPTIEDDVMPQSTGDYADVEMKDIPF